MNDTQLDIDIAEYQANYTEIKNKIKALKAESKKASVNDKIAIERRMYTLNGMLFDIAYTLRELNKNKEE